MKAYTVTFGILIALSSVFTDTEARASVLTFDITGISNNQIVSSAYGDNITAENTFLVDNFVLNGDSTDPLWIGLNDAATEGTFVWSRRQPVTYTNWQSAEPNNEFGNEDYVTINWHFAFGNTSDHGTWNDTL